MPTSIEVDPTLNNRRHWKALIPAVAIVVLTTAAAAGIYSL